MAGKPRTIELDTSIELDEAAVRRGRTELSLQYEQQPKGDKFQTLATELLGEAVAKRMVEEVWDAASDAQKKTLADSILREIDATLSIGRSQALRQHITNKAQDYIARMCNDVLVEVEPHYKEEIRKLISGYKAGLIENVFDAAIGSLKDRLARELRAELSKPPA